MKILCASDSFKGSLTSSRAGELLTKAAEQVFPGCETIIVPVADGGEGTVDAVIRAAGGQKVRCSVTGPLGDPVRAEYGLLPGGRAIIEMAAASGLPLVPETLRDPRNTTTYGTGQMIRDALDQGCRKLYLAIGGSATNDGGMGCAAALGVRFLDADGSQLEGYGRDLEKVETIDLAGLDLRFRETKLTVLCDVDNVLCGKDGATWVFGAQKGATPQIQEELERGMCHYRDVIRETLDVDCDEIPGAGAAGGLGAGLCVFLGGQMRSGIDTVLDLAGFDELLKGADLVVTGEGRTDAQSIRGKVMQGVGMRAAAQKVPVIGLSGALGDGAMEICRYGVDALMTTVDAPMTLEEAMERAEELYERAAVNMLRLVKAGMKIKE